MCEHDFALIKFEKTKSQRGKGEYDRAVRAHKHAKRNRMEKQKATIKITIIIVTISLIN